jgi:hypothetical protein
MGDQGGGSNQPPEGGTFNVSNNPVTVAAGLAGDILNAFTLTFEDGTSSGQLGGLFSGGDPFSFSYSGEILSSLHINGISQYYGSADCAVFGFKYAQTLDGGPRGLTPTLHRLASRGHAARAGQSLHSQAGEP